MTTLHKRLVTIDAKMVRHGRSILFQMAEVLVPRTLFQQILTAIAALRPASTMLRTVAHAGSTLMSAGDVRPHPHSRTDFPAGWGSSACPNLRRCASLLFHRCGTVKSPSRLPSG